MKGEALKRFLESTFEVIRHRCTSTEIVTICMAPGCHDGSGNRGFNLKTGLTHCWKCRAGGDAVRFLRWLGYAVDDAGAQSCSVEDLWAALDNPRPKSIVPVISEISLPKGFRCCYDQPDSQYTKQIGDMARRKNLEPEDLIQAGAGFTREGDWEPYCIFPVVDYERLVYFQGRAYWESTPQGKKFPNRREAPLSMKYWLYDLDIARASKAPTLVVVESILNVLSLKKKFAQEGITDMVPVCTFTHAVSKPQFHKILRLDHVKEVCLLFDYDARSLAWKDAARIDDLIRVSIAEMPCTTNKKLDPNDDVDAALRALEKRRPFSVAGQLEHSLNILMEERPSMGGMRWDVCRQRVVSA